MVDFEAYRRSHDKNLFRKTVSDFIDKMSSIEERKQQIKQSVDESLSQVDNNKAPFGPDAVARMEATRFSVGDRSLIFTNSEHFALENGYRNYLWKFHPNEKDYEIFNTLNFEHERGHAAYDLDDSGTAYMSTVETLIQNPQSRAVLLYLADCKLVEFVMRKDLDVENITTYGHETYKAMQAALALPQVELDKFAKMPPEARRTFLAERAQGFDQLAAMYKDMGPANQPEIMVRRALETDELKVTVPPDVVDVSTAGYDVSHLKLHEYSDMVPAAQQAKDIFQNRNPFSKDGSMGQALAYEMLRDFSAAMQRITETGYEKIKPQTAAKPTPLPDYESIRKSDRPTFYQEGDTAVLIIDVRKYRSLSESKRMDYKQDIHDHIQAMDYPEYLKRIWQEQADKYFALFDKPSYQLANNAGQMPPTYTEDPRSLNFGIILTEFETDRGTVPIFLDYLPSRSMTSMDYKAGNDFMIQHELAHLFNRSGNVIEEPGADYEAAVGVLVKYGDAARPFLQKIADRRAIVSIDEHEGKQEILNYNVANVKAIGAALALPRPELERLGRLSPAERRFSLRPEAQAFNESGAANMQIYAQKERKFFATLDEHVAVRDALQNDFVTRYWKGQRPETIAEALNLTDRPDDLRSAIAEYQTYPYPETRVREALQQRAQTNAPLYQVAADLMITHTPGYEQQNYDNAKDLLDNNCPFASGTREYEALNAYVEASKRIYDETMKQGSGYAPSRSPRAEIEEQQTPVLAAALSRPKI